MTSTHLVFHGSVILLASLLFGAPYARAIKRQADPQVTNSWRVAHQSLAMGALLLFALAAVQPFLHAPDWAMTAMHLLMVVSAYAFTVSTPLAAITRDRGLQSGSVGVARWVYIGNMVGAASSLFGAALLVLISGWTLLISR
jgi:hypothetical protein